MEMLQQLLRQYKHIDCRDLGSRQLEQLRDGLKNVTPEEIRSSADGKSFVELLRKFREAVAENDKLHGENYPLMLNSLLSVGEDGLYSNNLRFIFELIQNVDDCDFKTPDDCRLDMHFDFNNGVITLTYNEVGFTPFNVFAITGIAEAAKNVSASKNEIGEKGIGFKSVFGVANKVLIRSGWFSFELFKENFTIPVSAYTTTDYCAGTKMTLYVPGRVKQIYDEIKKQYCSKDALFSRNPLLFLNKLTSLRMYFDSWRSMEFQVSRKEAPSREQIHIERGVDLSVNLHDYDNGSEISVTEHVSCTRYSNTVLFSKEACKSRYGENTQVGGITGKQMILSVVVPDPEFVSDVGAGALYSFLPTQLKFTVPIVCHVPFKLDASREFVDPQDENLWFIEAREYLAQLMDAVYLDLRSQVKAYIALYIPGARENLFARNNGKEQCLSKQSSFSGQHYLELPLFIASDEQYYAARDVYCFSSDEDISDPATVHQLMGYRKALFVSSVSVKKLGLHIEEKANDQLFRKAIMDSSVTEEALEYLDLIEYKYPEQVISDLKHLILKAEQLKVIFKHKELLRLLQKLCNSYITKNMRLEIRVEDGCEKSLKDALYEEFEISEVPNRVRQYLKYCAETCICIDADDTEYLPCYNAIVLSKNNPIASFADFCYAIDRKDTFALRIKLRDASKQLDQVVADDTVPPEDYIRNLRNVRLLIRDSLGKEGYRSYVDLILRSGTDRNRYIQELLQNADDCDYPPESIPSFSLIRQGNVIIAEHNEIGFSRANIRSITAIGESTKNKLFNSDSHSIGEKGVGFKTIFVVASEVKIWSGSYSFALTDQEPTIPKLIKPRRSGDQPGTAMEIVLKNGYSIGELAEKDILELCLCLRKLKSIKIGTHTVTIEDSDDRRTITIDKRQHVFKRFVHKFNITNEEALSERRNTGRNILSDQSIVCMVAEKGGLPEYALYNGLPTKHRIKIPMVIDAPFALTTSREEIEQGSATWNGIIRNEMYTAIANAIEQLKTTERIRVLRFVRFVPRRQGYGNIYKNDISDCEYLTSYDWLAVLKYHQILPTLEKGTFIAPSEGAAYRFPRVAMYLFTKLPNQEFGGIPASSVIDVDSSEYDSALNAFGCDLASFEQSFPVIERNAERFIQKEDFRQLLFEYLTETTSTYLSRVKKLAIIPVLGLRSNNTEYVPWKDNSIFVKRNAQQSGHDYYILDVNKLPKDICERIYKCDLSVMDETYAKARYNEQLKQRIQMGSGLSLYLYLITEFSRGEFQRNDSLGTLQSVSGQIPLKNELGEITTAAVFLSNQPMGYFTSKLIGAMIAHKECSAFAGFIGCEELSKIHYDDIPFNDPLSADDIETLLDDYFVNRHEILRGFYADGLISDKLILEYHLEYLTVGRTNDSDEEYYDFPEDPVGDRSSIRNHVRKQWENPIKIVSVKVERTVQKGQYNDGSVFDLSIKDDREGALWIYTPEGANGKCFCQMCHSLKPYRLIEVNNIETKPTHYFSRLRISLCLECSKRFEFFRSNDSIKRAFLETIKTEKITPDQGTVDIPIVDGETVTFTAKHLAEVQEILLQKPQK